MTANGAESYYPPMTKPIHLVAHSTRQELLKMLTEALDPTTLSDRRERALRDCVQMLEEDNVRAGYARRFWDRVTQREDGHWIWTGAGQDTPDGRPVCNFEGKRVYAAKVAWLLVNSERVPEGFTLRKLCVVSRCLAPDCHRLMARVDAVGGRPSAIRRDDHGRPLCRRALHVLKREPKPREHVYCAPCRQQDRLDIEAAQRARLGVQRFQQRSPASAPFSLPEPPEDDPDSTTSHSGPRDLSQEEFDRIWDAAETHKTV